MSVFRLNLKGRLITIANKASVFITANLREQKPPATSYHGNWRTKCKQHFPPLLIPIREKWRTLWKRSNGCLGVSRGHAYRKPSTLWITAASWGLPPLHSISGCCCCWERKAVSCVCVLKSLTCFPWDERSSTWCSSLGKHWLHQLVDR